MMDDTTLVRANEITTELNEVRERLRNFERTTPTNLCVREEIKNTHILGGSNHYNLGEVESSLFNEFKQRCINDLQTRRRELSQELSTL